VRLFNEDGVSVGHLKRSNGSPEASLVLGYLQRMPNPDLTIHITALEHSGDRSYFWNVHGFTLRIEIEVTDDMGLYDTLLAEAVAAYSADGVIVHEIFNIVD
jgi:hypothetical protein